MTCAEEAVGTALDPRGIEHNVAAELQQMRVPFHHDRLEPALKQVSNPVVPAVEALSVNAVELAHSDGEIALGRLHQQV